MKTQLYKTNGTQITTAFLFSTFGDGSVTEGSDAASGWRPKGGIISQKSCNFTC